MNKYILIIIAVIFASGAFAQQQANYSQYMHDHYLINPAAAGVTDFMPISLGYKKVWTGFQGSPEFYSLAGNTKINDNMAVGAKVFTHKAGFEAKTGIDLSYAYSVKIGESNRLAFGLSASLFQYSLDKNQISLEDPNDNTVIYATDKLIVPDANFGTYFHGKDYYVGITVAQLFGRKVNMMNTDYLEQTQVRHYYFHGGYKWAINDDYSIEPSVLMKFVEAGEYQAELNVKATFKKIAWAGISYRMNDAIVPMFGIEMEKFLFGYAYDITMSDVKNYSQGSHELMFIYKLGSVSSTASL